MSLFYTRTTDSSDLDGYKASLQQSNSINLLANTIVEMGRLQNDVIEIEIEELRRTVDHASNEERADLIDGINAITGDMYAGFNHLSDHLLYVSNEIGHLSNVIAHELELVIANQKLTNYILERIENLVSLPNSYKECVHYLNQGLIWLKSAKLEGFDSQLYSAALDDFEKAESFDPRDCYTLFQIGFIYLKSNLLNPARAEDYYKRAATFASAKFNSGGLEEKERLCMRQVAVQADIYAAEAAYLQNNCSAAVHYCERAEILSPNFLLLLFLKSKYLSASSEFTRSAKIMKDILVKDHRYAKSIKFIKVLYENKEIINVINELTKKLEIKNLNTISTCRSVIVENSVASKRLHALADRFIPGNFQVLSELRIELARRQQWVVNEVVEYDSHGCIRGIQGPVNFEGNIIALIRFEKRTTNHMKVAKIISHKASRRLELQNRFNDLLSKKEALDSEKDIGAHQPMFILCSIVAMVFVPWIFSSSWIFDLDRVGLTVLSLLKIPGFLVLVGAVIFGLRAAGMLIDYKAAISPLKPQIELLATELNRVTQEIKAISNVSNKGA